MSNQIICWVILVIAGIFSAVSLTAAALWALDVKVRNSAEKDKVTAWFKLLATAILFVVIIFGMSYLSTFVKL